MTTGSPGTTATPTPQQPALLRGAAREKLDLTMHGQMLTEGQGSPDVIINDEGAWRERISKHTCTAHGEEIVLAGVQQIYINDVRAVRIHDYLKGSGPLDAIVTGSPDVFMGDEGFGFSSRDEFCKKFNELMAAWPTMTEAERRAAMQTFVNDMSASQGMPAPTVNTGNASAASFNPWEWQMNLPENQNQLYAGSSSPNIYAEPNLTAHEQCKFGETIVHELRHQQMGWNGLRKIAQDPSIGSSLRYWPHTQANLPPSVWTAAQNSPIPAGDPADTAGANAVWDYYNGDFDLNGMHNYVHSPGGSDAARHETAVGCCSSGP